MRKILFRGKRKDNGEWIEGSLLLFWDSTYIVPTSTNTINRIEVVPETVGQFTGFTDMNGKKIFEGDVVRSCFGQPYSNGTYIVKFVNDRGGWYPFANGDGCGCCEEDTYPPTDDGTLDYFVVIDNIHDNPIY
jgi:hypothetical protein